MTVTTTTIANRCYEEDTVDDHLYRVEVLRAELEGDSLKGDEIQLACEAIKFHLIRNDGFDFDCTLTMMGLSFEDEDF
jgi:hypothetical protein